MINFEEANKSKLEDIIGVFGLKFSESLCKNCSHREDCIAFSGDIVTCNYFTTVRSEG